MKKDKMIGMRISIGEVIVILSVVSIFLIAIPYVLYQYANFLFWLYAGFLMGFFIGAWLMGRLG